ncbi:MAG: hypothetical protein ACLQBX_10940 [Candidatus Limnocylindrales bacterium]
MSLRPRFAGQGYLRLPGRVAVLRSDSDHGDAGDIVGQHGPQGYDPFGRTANEELLLAEAFARFDFSRPRKAQQWYLKYGVPDLRRLFPNATIERRDWPIDGDRFHDALGAVQIQQRNVRWHLLALARLSAAREQATPPRRGRRRVDGWDTAWSQPALLDPFGDVRWLGAVSDYEARITPPMRYLAQVGEDLPLNSYTLHGLTARLFTDEWWPTAHATWRRIKQDGIPVVWVPMEAWARYWPDLPIQNLQGSRRQLVGTLSADWDGLVELERRLMEAYVRRAGQSEVVLERRDDAYALSQGGKRESKHIPGPVEVREERWWRSLLIPVYLQLLEGLRRVTEGHSGAAFCRECGEPFLTLDARRSSFCNERERFRFTQRARRERLAAPPPNVPRGMPR